MMKIVSRLSTAISKIVSSYKSATIAICYFLFVLLCFWGLGETEKNHKQKEVPVQFVTIPVDKPHDFESIKDYVMNEMEDGPLRRNLLVVLATELDNDSESLNKLLDAYAKYKLSILETQKEKKITQ